MPQIINSVKQSVLELQAGRPVAIPTETVYGLAALINKPEAIKAVFSMKNRPLNHPLIMHVGVGCDLRAYVEHIPDYAQQLMDLFWPGPMTLVFKAQKDQIDPLITGGQTTVALRCPAHPITQDILHQLGLPLVAPSANPFGKISPTTAQHVYESFPKQDLLILDGGRCAIGIESTIIDATQDSSYQILRHGLINEHSINSKMQAKILEIENNLRVPGKLESHYQPKKPLYYFESSELLEYFCQNKTNEVFVIAKEKPSSLHPQFFYPLNKEPGKVAYDLYYTLRQADASQAQYLAIELPPATSEWYGIRERIMKAGSLYKKAISK